MLDDNKTNIISQYESDKCDRQFHHYKPSKRRRGPSYQLESTADLIVEFIKVAIENLLEIST